MGDHVMSSGRGTVPRTLKRGPSSVALTTDPKAGKRLNLNLSNVVYRELSSLATERRSSMTDVVRFALGLVKIAFQEAAVGNKLVVTTADGKPLKEIVVP
jgi:hypothetical protein